MMAPTEVEKEPHLSGISKTKPCMTTSRGWAFSWSGLSLAMSFVLVHFVVQDEVTHPKILMQKLHWFHADIVGILQKPTSNTVLV